MIFHIIDLREVGEDWLACIECRCSDGFGTYLDRTPEEEEGLERDKFGVAARGGVSCCSNCTSLDSPTVDYRMRYNVSYSDIPDEGPPVAEVMMLTADISPAVGKNIEFDVPRGQFLPSEIRGTIDADLTGDYQFVQRLVREGKFRDIFQHDFFGDKYHGPDDVGLLRCVGHLHVAALGMWLEDAKTGEVLCAGEGSYGTDPSQDKGFLTAIAVQDYSPEPRIISADLPIRIVTEYDATDLHTGVMGMWFVFADARNKITRSDADLIVDVCLLPSCDIDLLPDLSTETEDLDSCFDALPDSPACKFGGMCDCDSFVNAPESTGCGGVYETNNGMGDVVVNDVCAEYCGCPSSAEAAAAGGGGGSCVDALPESPACKFGNLCSCEEVVSATESTGCGGVYTSQMGDMVVNEICASYCDACPEEEDDVDAKALLLEEAIAEQMGEYLTGTCLYATEECRLALSNLYTCGANPSGLATSLDPAVESFLVKHGKKMAMERRLLGHQSLHRGGTGKEGMGEEVQPCHSASAKEDDVSNPKADDGADPDIPAEKDEDGGAMKSTDATSGAAGSVVGGSGWVCLLLHTTLAAALLAFGRL